jgi:NTE family protein
MKSMVLRLSLVFVCSSLLVLFPHIATAQEDTYHRPKIGLVLGGGGAKGAAHIGVLKVLEEQHIPIDYIAGTSMGAIVGSLYASGLSAAEIEKILTSVDWKDLFTDTPPRQEIDFRRKQEDYQFLTKLELGLGKGGFRLPKGIVGAQKVNVLFETLMLHASDVTDFDKLPIPFRAVAADLETGEMVVIRSGSLAAAARASMSVPGVFPPVAVDDHYLVDGGIVRNLPIDIVKGMGADVIIAIDVGKPLLKRDKLGSALSVMGQMLDIMIKKNVAEQIALLGEKDVFIRPELGDIESGDFERGAETARLGEQAARTQVESLRRYSTSEQEYGTFLARHHRDLVTSVKVASVKVGGTERVSPETVASRIEVKPGETVDVASLERDAQRVYGLGDFERVDYRLSRQGDAYDVMIRATEKSWGPNYFRIGLALDSDFEGDSNFNLLAEYTMRWLNRLGAEWKNQLQIGTTMMLFSEFYQPLNYSRFFFVAPRVEWKQWPVDVYDGDRRVAQYRIRTLEGGIDLGIQPWTYGEARLGLARPSSRQTPGSETSTCRAITSRGERWNFASSLIRSIM